MHREEWWFLWFDLISSQWTEEDEIADYKRNRDWMDECVDGMFERWYDKIDEEGSMEDRRKVCYRVLEMNGGLGQKGP